MSNTSAAAIDEKGGKNWVQFEDNSEGGIENVQSPPSASTPAVIDTQLSQINIESKERRGIAKVTSELLTNNQRPVISSVPSTTPVVSGNESRSSVVQLNASQLHNVPLSDSANNRPLANVQPVIRQGFANGDVIVGILPQNTSLPWITPARFRPELVPEELMAQGLTLTVEDYVNLMTQLVNDSRFTLYNIFYKRILAVWISLGFVILLAILFSGLTQLVLFGAGILWLFLNACAIFLCMWVKIKLCRSLERCIARINFQLLKHKMLMGLDDRGKLSCHKVTIVFVYFDTQDCLNKLQEHIDQESREAATDENRMKNSVRYDIDDQDIIVAGSTNTRISRQQERALLLLTRYSQRWVKEYLRKRLDWEFDSSARIVGLVGPATPRHLSTARCPCQYIEDYLIFKSARHPQEQADCCACLSNFCDDDF